MVFAKLRPTKEAELSSGHAISSARVGGPLTLVSRRIARSILLLRTVRPIGDQSCVSVRPWAPSEGAAAQGHPGLRTGGVSLNGKHFGITKLSLFAVLLLEQLGGLA